MSFNIKIPFVISSHIKKFTATSSLKNKNKAAAVGLVNNYLVYHNGTAVQKVNGLSTAPVSLAAASLTLDPKLHDGVVVVTNIASGFTITLPAATGSGVYFRVMVGTTLTSGTGIVQVANASDFMRGQASTIGGSGITVAVTANTGTPSTESDTITWNRGTTGLGTIGDYIEAYDLAANIWSVEAIYQSSGAAATPFSAAV